jgi:DNA helicase-2/ATP-dependent DNA helicase PcrA
VARPDPDTLLADLDPEQREAVLAVSGPVAILAGAGSGKTRVLSRRTGYAIASGVVPADQALVVTFTDKAAGEMVARLRTLGLPRVTARTFHAHALSQLRFFWPLRHDGSSLPALLDSKAPILGRLARQLPGHYRFTPTKDVADEIEWAKARRVSPAAYEQEAAAAGREPPIPVDLFVRLFDGYERAKERAGRIDFDDLLVRTVDLLETDADAAATIRARKRWFSVDEYQDTSPLQQRLLELWLGESRDLGVVGDEDQTIYSFTGASPVFLLTFESQWPGARVVSLTRNYRSTPQVLDLANRLIASEGRSKRLVATRDDGPAPSISRHPSAEHELAALVAWIRARIAEGVAPAEVAVLVRMNAQLAPIEEGLTRGGVAYQVRGIRFYDRPEVRAAMQALRRPAIAATGAALASAIRERWAEAVGYEADGEEVEGDEARERQASLDTLLAIVEELAAADPAPDAARVSADLEARAAHEREGSADGVNLATYHRAKGLEWDAVFLPSLEEGILPIRQAHDAEDAVAEERRLLYVGITRARVHLALSWAERRETRGREARRQPSRFLLDMRPPRGTIVTQLPGPPVAVPAPSAAEGPLFDALRTWRTTRARADGMPPYVIAHDATLRAIAEARPRTLAALRRVKGMGEQKLDRYGDEILAALAAAEG